MPALSTLIPPLILSLVLKLEACWTIVKKMAKTWNGDPGLSSLIGLQMSRQHSGLKSRYLGFGHPNRKSIQLVRLSAMHTMGLAGKLITQKKTAHERKIDSKRIKGRCPNFVQIKTYSHINTVLGKYNHDHSHPTDKDNLKYIWIQTPTHELIESWVHYGVTD